MIVSLIIPVRNEEHFIIPCLKSILSSDFPKNEYEILIIDGRSRDRTREKLKRFDWKGVSHRVLNNPHKIVPFALNAGIRSAEGKYVLRMDAHTEYQADYISQCVTLLDQKIADNVGGPMRVRFHTPLQQAIAIATCSVFGVGNSPFHFKYKSGYVDTVYLGAFPKATFEKFGLFDEEMVRNQDDEFNYRIIRNGGKIYLSPGICSYYYPRDSLTKLFSQYFQYGLWKVRVLQKLGTLVSLRHLIPSGLVLTLSLTLLGSLYNPRLFGVLLLGLSGYVTVGLVMAAILSIRNRFRRPFLLLTVFASLHFSYGIGFIAGLFKFTLASKN